VLKQRVLTALALLPPVLAVIVFASPQVLFSVFSIAGLLMAWEWTALMGLEARSQRTIYLALTGLSLGLAWAFQAQASAVFAAALIWWCLALCLLPGFPENLAGYKPGVVVMGLIGLLMIVPAILALALLQSRGFWVLLFALVLVWVADIGAYFAGRAFGRRKLAPLVSPGKTLEGALGGLAASAAWVLAIAPLVFTLSDRQQLILLALSMVVVMFSIVGDLTESAFKRLAGVKDSGAILPGHGGILDRTDSLLAAMPIFALGLGFVGQ